MKENSYVVIQAFMLNDLHLKGNELIVYAVIYGYTQDGKHWYYGTRGHLAEWCGATKGTVTNCLNSLLDKGYIVRREVERPGHVEIQYQATPCQKSDGGTKNCDTPLSKIGSINILEDNKDNKGDSGKRDAEYPASLPCQCGSQMQRTASYQTGTRRPLYRCPKCGEEGVCR